MLACLINAVAFEATKIEDTCLDAIIRGVEESVSYASSLEAFSHESTEVKLCLLHSLHAKW